MAYCCSMCLRTSQLRNILMVAKFNDVSPMPATKFPLFWSARKYEFEKWNLFKKNNGKVHWYFLYHVIKSLKIKNRNIVQKNKDTRLTFVPYVIKSFKSKEKIYDGKVPFPFSEVSASTGWKLKSCLKK